MLTAVKGGGGQRYWSDSEVYRCAGGNDQLARRLAEAIGADRIRLGMPVAEVRYSRPDDPLAAASVTCADGGTFACDQIVVAIPPSTWRAIRWTPELPGQLNQQQMGTAVKYLAAVKQRYWLDAQCSQYAISDGPISQTWESTDGQWAAGEGEPTAGLTAFSGGPQADQCLSFHKGQLDARYAAALENLYPGFRRHFIAGRFMDWPRQPHTLAGYSFPAPGQITSMGAALREGIGRLHFCGEHTCYRFAGYMEGGLYSGAALAARIAAHHALVPG